MVDPTEEVPRIRFEALRIRVEGARDAQKRSRLAFVVMTIASVAIIITTYNFHVSWDRHFATTVSYLCSKEERQTGEPAACKGLPAPTDKVDDPNYALSYEVLLSRQAQLDALQEWIRNGVIQVPLLGVRMSISDAAVLGSLGLFIISIWFFFSLRRENHLIGSLLRETQDQGGETMEYVYHGIVSYLVFTVVTDSDAPLRDLRGTEVTHRRILMRGALRVLFFLPAVAIAFVILMDVFSVAGISAALRFPHVPLISHLDAWDWFKLVLFELSALVFGLATCLVCIRAVEYEAGTGDMLREYSGALQTLRTP